MEILNQVIDSPVGVDSWDLRWDGTINGQDAPEGVYTWYLEVWSCHEGSNQICQEDDSNKYPNSRYLLYSGDFTLTR